MAGLTYSTGAPSGANQQPVLGAENASSTKAGTANQTVKSNQTQTTQSSQVQAVNMSNMTADGLAAMQQLIQQLIGGQPLMSREEAAIRLRERGIVDPAVKYKQSIANGFQSSNYGFMGSSLMNTDTTTRNAYQLESAEYEAQLKAIQMGGPLTQAGTPEQQQQSKQIQGEITTLQAAREGYSKKEAFIDASALQANAMRKMLEAVLPQLNQAIEASGTSGGATSGLLANDAAARAAESAAALGLQAAVDYGHISNDMSKVLSDLIDKSPVVLNSLLQALTINKGSVQSGTTSSAGSQAVSSSGSQLTSGNTKERTDQSSQKIATPATRVAGQQQTDVATPFGNYRF